MKITRCDECGKDQLPLTRSERGRMNIRYEYITVKLGIYEDEKDFCSHKCLHAHLDKKLHPMVQAPQTPQH